VQVQTPTKTNQPRRKVQQGKFRSALREFRESRFGFVAMQAVLLVFLWTILRVVLFQMFSMPATTPTDTTRAFLIGLHLDVTASACIMLPLLVWCCLMPNRWIGSTLHRAFISTTCLIFWVVQVFLLFVEFFFFDEFKSRFNTVAIDYLMYPHEVFVNIRDSYPITLILIVAIAGGGTMYFAARQVATYAWNPVSRKVRFAMLLLGLGVTTALVATSTFSEAKFSNERTLNEIANNGAVSLVTAAWSHNLDYTAYYKTMDKAAAFARTRKMLEQEGSQFVADPTSLRRHVAGDASRPKLNVVVMLEESLGSEFWGSLGRKGETLTPNLDKLAGEGLLFENIYATGNRTVRGFEGVLSSFPPLPGDSIVKRDHSENVETIARVLKRDGYDTMFLYGGRGLFDGMRSFTVHNGYDRFIEQKDFPNPTYTTIWGVCNEDLYNKTLDELRTASKTGRPFLATVLSVSNHKPYLYPPGRIPEDPKAQKREYAVKYTDWALGQFFEAAKKEPFWTNTIFVVVADHGARVYGQQTIPIHSYEIPLVFLGPAAVKSPARNSILGSQVDVVPTILGILGRPYDSMFYGRDLLKPHHNFVIVNHNRDIGMYRDQHLAVLNLQKGVEFFHGDPKGEEMKTAVTPDAQDLELEKDATALFQTADDLYMGRRYHIDEN
jgi:phosphoglycerol transferase MdoB-like AlkP superfamily enzyme